MNILMLKTICRVLSPGQIYGNGLANINQLLRGDNGIDKAGKLHDLIAFKYEPVYQISNILTPYSHWFKVVFEAIRIKRFGNSAIFSTTCQARHYKNYIYIYIYIYI